MSGSDPKEDAKRILGYLRKLKEDRGAMAELRCALSPTKLPRAWPLLGRLGGIGNSRIETIAGLFAHHPDETTSGNLGTTCLRLKKAFDSRDTRFRRLLGCDWEDICTMVRPVVLAAKSKRIPINYETLFADLCYWGDNVKARWAKEYWGTQESEEEAALSPEETEQ
jgi:CRISPR system Cascade subunit CasB